jgi:hypothetical protein
MEVLKPSAEAETSDGNVKLFGFLNQLSFSTEGPHLGREPLAIQSPQYFHQMSLRTAYFEVVNEVRDLGWGH